MKIKMGPSAPPLHEQLGVDRSEVKGEQVMLDMITMANKMGGFNQQATREKHCEVLQKLEKKGLIKLKS